MSDPQQSVGRKQPTLSLWRVDQKGVTDPNDFARLVVDMEARLTPISLKAFYTNVGGYCSRWDNVYSLYRSEGVEFPQWAYQKWAHSAWAYRGRHAKSVFLRSSM